MIARLAALLAGLAGWRRALVAFAFGVAATAALPPFYLLPLLIVAFTGLLWQLEGCRAKRDAAVIGWSFGIGFFATGLYWIAESMLVDAARHAWLIPFAMVGLSGGLALFPAGVAVALLYVRRRRWVAGAGVPFAFALLWTFSEWLRGWLLTGFPWHLVGTAWVAVEPVLQFAAVAGVFGLSLLTATLAALPAALAAPDGTPARRPAWIALGAAVAALAVIWIGGAWRLNDAPDPRADPVPGVILRIVQASILQHLKWRDDLRSGHVRRQIALSRGPGEPAPSHVIWPETAVPFYLESDEGLRQALGAAVPPGGLLITGAPRFDGPAGARRYYNSVQALNADGVIVATYDKVHLVPFGEYMPLGDLLPWGQLAAGAGAFSAGPERRTLNLPGLPPLSPLVCYEVIFPGAVARRDAPPAWLLNVTNDAWFGRSAGPHQHLALARVRAVEEGLPLVRAANTGISAVVDPYGRVMARLGIGVAGVIDEVLPRPLDGATPFRALGEAWLVALGLLWIVVARLSSRP